MKYISTKDAPQAIGPYSQAIEINNILFCSGQIPLDKNGNLVTGSITKQAEQVFKNISVVITAAGYSMNDIVKVTVYLTDLSNFAELNNVYSKFITTKPARSTVQVARLPKDASIEIDVTAVRKV